MLSAALTVVLGAASVSTEPAAAASEPPSRFAGELALLGVVELMPGNIMGTPNARRSYGGEVLLPGLSISGQAGVRLSEGFALVGVAAGDFLFGQHNSSQLLVLGAGVQFGVRHHLTLAAGPGFWRTSGVVPGVDGAGPGSFVSRGVLGVARVKASIALIRGLALALETGLIFSERGGASAHFAVGLGGSY